jgi:hypothetical protein
MALGDKLFEESGNITGLKITKVHPFEGLNIMTGFTNSQKLSWMNHLIIAIEVSGSVFSQKFNATGYEWK